MRTLLRWFAGSAIVLTALPASADIIQVSPADGVTAYTKIEAARAGDEVVIAPGTYAFRVYLQAQGTASQPIHIHAADPANPPVWDFGDTLVEKAPGSYTAPDKNRGCWQVSGGANYVIEGIVFQNCHNADNNSAGIRYYGATKGLVIRNCLFQNSDNGLTGGTDASDATVEFCEFSQNGNLKASAPTHNIYIYGGTFALRYSYLHDPIQGQDLHCRAVSSTIEYNWFDRAKSYVGDLMTSDDYANNPVGSLAQSMLLRGNVIIQGAGQDNTGQIWALYNDEASGSPVSFSVTAVSNTVIGAGGHAAFVHLSNADNTQMSADVSNNIIAGTSQPILVESAKDAMVRGTHNWIQTGAAASGLSASISSGAPGFSSAASLDFTLAAGSPCMGAADTSVADPPTEEYYENETVTRKYRVRATANDVGAFEHTTVGPGVGPDGADAGTTVASSSSSSGVSTSSSGVSTSSSEASTSSTGVSSSTGAGTGGGGAGPSESGGGCGCTTVGRTEVAFGASPLWATAVLGWVCSRRRRRRQAR